MSLKVYLATALKDLEQCRAKERALDHVQEKIAKSSTSRKDLVQLKRDYSALFDRKISAIEYLNYVRNNATENADMKSYCEKLMKTEMDNAERLRDKEANILLPVELIGDITKEGYVKKRVLYSYDGNKKPLLKDKPIQERIPVPGGCYLVTVRNFDDYMASPNVEVTIGCSPQQRTMRRILPNLCGWGRFIGTVGESHIQVEVKTDAILRASHVSVEVQELVELDNEWADLPSVNTAHLGPRTQDMDLGDGDDGTFNLHTYEDVPIPGSTPTKIDMSLPLRDRVEVVDRMVLTWPVNHVTACPLTFDEQRLMQCITNLPIPTPLA